MIGYHFVGETLRDGRPVPFDGEWLEHNGPLVMCQSGLHWSPTPWEALQYAPGAVLCEVEGDGEMLEDSDKRCSRRRRIIRRVNLTEVCRKFAQEQALSVIHLWKAPEIVRRFLDTGDESIRVAARAAARAAAGAARDAARDAAEAAAKKRFNQLALAALDEAAQIKVEKKA